LVHGPAVVHVQVCQVGRITGACVNRAAELAEVRRRGPSQWLGAYQSSEGAIRRDHDQRRIVWTATPSNKLTFALKTLVNPTPVGSDVGGPMANFDPVQSYAWPAVHWDGKYSGPTDAPSLTASTAFETAVLWAAIIDAVRSTADKPVLQLTIRLLELRTKRLPPLNDKLRKACLPEVTLEKQRDF